MKTCSYCKIEKPIEEFQKRSSSRDGFANRCKICKRLYDNNHYANNPNRKNYIRENRIKAYQESKKYIYEYLLEHPCVDCGEKDIVVLEFDHIKGDKKGNVARLKASSKSAVIEEIKKCEVRCANCHRRKTAEQFGWNKISPL